LPGRLDQCLHVSAPGGQLTTGQLTTGQLSTIGDVSARYGAGPVAIVGQRFQLPLIPAPDLPAVTARLRAAGLAVTEPPDDAAPVFTGSPVAGIAADEIIDGTSALRKLIGQAPSCGPLPSAFTTTISGSPRPDVLPEASDVSFTGVRHPRLGPGFDVRVGAALAARPLRPGRLGAFVTAAEVPAVWAAIVAAFRDFGHRPLDRRERLALLIAGPAAAFRRMIEREYLPAALADGYPPPLPNGPRDHIGVHPQRDGRCYIGVTPGADRAPLTALAALAEAHGSTRLRITPYQKLIVLDIPPPRVESFCTSLTQIGLTARPALSHRRSAGW